MCKECQAPMLKALLSPFHWRRGGGIIQGIHAATTSYFIVKGGGGTEWDHLYCIWAGLLQANREFPKAGMCHCSVKGLDVSAEDSGIRTIPLITLSLQAIWSKVAVLFQSITAITLFVMLSCTIVTLPMLCNQREAASIYYMHMSAIQTAHNGCRVIHACRFFAVHC